MDNKAQKRIDKLKQEILAVEAGLKDEKTPADVKADLEESLIIMRSDLEKLEKKSGKKPSDEPKKIKKPREKKQVASKPRVKIAGKSFTEISASECLEAYRRRRQKAKTSAKKSKTKSIVSKIASHLGTVAEQAIKSIPASEIKDKPVTAIKDIKKIGEVVEDALAQIKKILGKYVESSDLKLSAEAKKDLESFENLAKELKKKYDK